MTDPMVWPALRYDDAPGALRFLTDVLGFRVALSVPDDAGDVVHAELRWPYGGGVMLGSTKHREGVHAEQRAGSCSTYLVAETAAQVDELHARCAAAGAELVGALEDTDYGSHAFTVRDPESNLWTIGTYRGTP